MKKTISFILSLVMFLGVMTSVPVTVNAASVDDLSFQLNDDGKSYSVTGCNYEANGEIVIPEKYNGLPVTGIGEWAFDYCSDLTSITIPDSVTSIGGYAFNDCSSLTSIVIPENVNELQGGIFYDCTNLVSITLLGSITYISSAAFYNTGYYNDINNWENGVLYLKDYLIEAERDTLKGSYTIKEGTKLIANGAFEYCDDLTAITIPNSVINIPGYAFYNCSNLAEANIGNGVTVIEDYAFSDCSSLTSVTIGDSVTSIGERAFCNCSNLGSITIPDSVTSIGNYAFYNCKSLTSVTIPHSVTSIGYDVFFSCTNIKSVYITDIVAWCKIDFGDTQANPMYWADTLYLNGEVITDIVLPEGITNIPVCAFKGCDIAEIVIPDSVTSIGERAFYCCYDLDSIEIPDSVISIGEDAFDNTSYYYNDENWENGILYINNYLIDVDTSITGDCIIKEGTKCIAEGVFRYSSFQLICLPESLKNISDRAFFGCSNLVSVDFSSKIETIGYGAFQDCTLLTSLTFGENIKSIGDEAFWNCTGLQDITFSNCDIEIGNDAFWFCENLEKIIVNDSTLNCGGWVFNGCEKINSVCITDIAKWCNSSFGSYSNPLLYTDNFYLNGDLVSEIDVPYGVTKIGDGVFSNFEALSSVNIPETVTSIGKSAFEECINLTAISIPDSVITIGECAFLGCESIEIIDIPDSVMNIGSQAFYGCKGLKTANLGNGIKNAEWYTFGYCDKLEEVVIKEGASIIPDYCFYGCESLKSINIPDSVTSIGSLALGYFGDVKGGVTPLENFTVYGTLGSEAHNYAKENSFKFIDTNHSHTSSSWITNKKATVYSDGEKYKECTECGEILETATIKQLKCSKPKLSKISNTSSGVKISWGKVSGADTYRVYRKTKNGSWKYLGSTSKTSYTDKTAKSGTKYYYALRARNEAGNSSLSSSLSKYYLADPTLKTPKSTKNGVSLKWTKTTGAQGYIIYRKTGNGSYKKLKTEKGVSNLSYVDKSAKKGKKYTYKVKAYYSKTYSAYSNTKTIKDKY